MHTIGSYLLLTTMLIAAAVHASEAHDDAPDLQYWTSEDAQEAFTGDGAVDGPAKMSDTGTPQEACPLRSAPIGQKYSHRFAFDMHSTDSDTDDDVDAMPDAERRIRVNAALSIELMESSESSELFRLDVNDVDVMGDSASKETMLKNLDPFNFDEALTGDNDDLALSRKFMGQFFYRQSCEAEILEVSQDEDADIPSMLTDVHVAVRAQMIASFLHFTHGFPESEDIPVIPVPSPNDSAGDSIEDSADMEDEEDDDDEEQADLKDEQADLKDEQADLKDEQADLKDEQADLKDEQADLKDTNQDSSSEVPEAKKAAQPAEEPTLTSCQKSPDTLTKEMGKRTHEKCDATPSTLASKFNQTCAKMRVVRPRS